MVVELSWFQVEDVENPHSGPTTASTTNSTFNYARDIAPSIAIDDYAAAVYSDGELSRVVSWSDNATAFHVSLEDGLAKEQRYNSERLIRDRTQF